MQKVSEDEHKSAGFRDELTAYDLSVEAKLGQANIPIMPNEFLIDEDNFLKFMRKLTQVVICLRQMHLTPRPMTNTYQPK